MHQSQPVSLLCLISELGKRQKVTAILEKHESLFTLVSYGKGTAGKKILNYLGLGETGKIIFIKLLPGAKAKELMNALDDGLQLDTPSHGIAFIADVDQVCFHRHIDCAGQTDGGSSTMPNKSPYHLIFAVLNRGYAEEVMAAARAGGATGGTSLHAQGYGMASMQKFFGTTIAPEKEILMIVTEGETSTAVMDSIAKETGPETDACAVSFSIPISDVRGLHRVVKEA